MEHDLLILAYDIHHDGIIVIVVVMLMTIVVLHWRRKADINSAEDLTAGVDIDVG